MKNDLLYFSVLFFDSSDNRINILSMVFAGASDVGL